MTSGSGVWFSDRALAQLLAGGREAADAGLRPECPIHDGVPFSIEAEGGDDPLDRLLRGGGDDVDAAGAS